MEDFGPEKCRVGATEDGKRLDDPHMLCESTDRAAENSVDKPDKCPAKRNKEERQKGHKDVQGSHGSRQGREGVHGVVEDDRDSIVEEGLPKDEEVEAGVDFNLFKDGEDGNRVDGRDEGAKSEGREEFQGGIVCRDLVEKMCASIRQ